MKRIYLDFAAATPVDARVLHAMEPYWDTHFGNPNAIHAEGIAALGAVSEARKRIATVLGVHADELTWTGSATESANLAVLGVVRAWRARYPERTPHVVVSAIEHDAVLEPVRMLEAEGVRVTRLPVRGDGRVDPALLSGALTPDTVLVSIMYANNEIGVIQPLRDIAKVLRKWKKEHRGAVRTERPVGEARYPLFHTDAAQAANYCEIRVLEFGVDLLTLSAAKIYGPKGVGLLYVARDTEIAPMIVGGGQERGLRAGTENVPGIVGFALALALAQELREVESSRLQTLRDHAIERLVREVPGIFINGSCTMRLPNNINFSLPDREVDHEFLALALDARGFAVATKSACGERHAAESHVLAALRKGEVREGPLSGIRMTLGRGTTRADIDTFIEELKSIQQTMLTKIIA